MTRERLDLVTGKGGSGRSAVAAAMAVAAVDDGARVLAIDMDATGGLPAHLGMRSARFESRVRGGGGSGEPTEVRPGLSVIAIDRAAALSEYLRVQMSVPTAATVGPIARIFDALASTAPAIREIVTLGKVLWEVKRGGWDLVVGDAPSTGQIPGYLRAPRTIGELVPKGRIRNQADWMDSILTDGSATTRLVVVSVLEELPVTETSELVSWLDSEFPSIHRTIVANRALSPLPATEPSGDGITDHAADLQRALVAEQSDWEKVLSPDHTLPALFGPTGPEDVVAHLLEGVATW